MVAAVVRVVDLGEFAVPLLDVLERRVGRQAQEGQQSWVIRVGHGEAVFLEVLEVDAVEEGLVDLLDLLVVHFHQSVQGVGHAVIVR